MATIEGNVIYRERIMLPPGAQVEVQLQDVSRPDAMATVMSSVLITPQGGPPYPFSIEYDPSQIDQRMTYALRATITRDGQLLFTNTDYIHPFSGNPVEVLVRSVPGRAQASGPALEETHWGLRTLAGEAAGTGAGGKPVDLQFQPEDQRAGGFSGCNRYSGGYSREGDASGGSPLSFGPTAGTMMACPEGMELERAYLAALGRTARFRLTEGTLVLLDEADTELATFGPLE